MTLGTHVVTRESTALRLLVGHPYHDWWWAQFSCVPWDWGSTFRSIFFQVQFNHLWQPHRSTPHNLRCWESIFTRERQRQLSVRPSRGTSITSPECLPIRNKQFRVTVASNCRSQWPHGLRHESSSPARTLGSWVRIPLEVWMSVCVYSVFVLFCM
jgi:hypothetical protein